MTSILLVAQLSPPSPVVAARRTAGLTKYLGRLGHEVTVLTSAGSGDGAIEGAHATVRTHDLAATRLNWRRSGAEVAGAVAPTGAVRGLDSWIVPDVSLATWLPFAFPQALRLAHRERFDCVITSGPPASAHFIGAALQRLGLRWIADFRDGWTFDAPRPPFPLAVQRQCDAALERYVAQRADAVIGVTEPITRDLRERLGANAHLITNGFDPEERRDPRLADGLVSRDRHSLVHTGRAGISGRSPGPLLEALRLLRRTEPETAARLEVVFAGALSPEETALFADPALDGMVRPLGALDRPRALSLQQAADSLLVIAAGASERSVATGKLYEYLTAERPILVLGDRSEAARIVAATGTGIATGAGDPEAIADALRQLLTGLDTERRPDAIAAYSWEALGRRAAEIVTWAAMNDATQQELPPARRLAVHASEVLDRFGLAEPAFNLYQRFKGREAEPGHALDGLPLPSAQLRFKVIGDSDPHIFLDTGAAQAKVLREHLGPALAAPPRRLLDFGVGCGRVARHWNGLNDGVEVHGTDYNPRLVEWVQGNLPFVQAATNGLEPPLRYPEEHFDAIYAISLLTHWPAELQVAWMQELRRVMAPGGRLVITTHGEGLTVHMLAEERERFAAGELVVRNVRSPGSNLCVTYHPPAWVRAHLLDGFTELAWTPTAPGFAQDVWVLERL